MTDEEMLAFAAAHPQLMRAMAKVATDQAADFFARMARKLAPGSADVSGEHALLAFANAIETMRSPESVH